MRTTHAHFRNCTMQKHRVKGIALQTTKPTHINSVPNFLKLMERHNLLEIIEKRIAGCIVREIGDRCRPRPGNDRCEQDANENRSSHAVQH